MKERIKRWYKQGLWTAEMVHNAVGKNIGGAIFTPEDYKDITGEEYTE